VQGRSKGRKAPRSFLVGEPKQFAYPSPKEQRAAYFLRTKRSAWARRRRPVAVAAIFVIAQAEHRGLAIVEMFCSGGYKTLPANNTFESNKIAFGQWVQGPRRNRSNSREADARCFSPRRSVGGERVRIVADLSVMPCEPGVVTDG
jgi:hypothetical protein